MYYKIIFKTLLTTTLTFITLLFISCSDVNITTIYAKQKQALSNNNPKKTQNNKNDTLTIVGIGDSLTYGTGDTLENGYITRLKKILTTKNQKVNTINLAVPGATTNDLIKMINNPEIKKTLKQVQIICITIGGNDLLQMTPYMSSKTNLPINELNINKSWANNYTILTKLHEINSEAHIYWLDLYNPFEIIPKWQNVSRKYILSWNQNLEAVANQFNNTTTISLYNLFMNNPEHYLYKDNFHPNSLGYHLIAQKLSERVLQDLNISKHNKMAHYSPLNKIITKFKN